MKPTDIQEISFGMWGIPLCIFKLISVLSQERLEDIIEYKISKIYSEDEINQIKAKYESVDNNDLLTEIEIHALTLCKQLYSNKINFNQYE